MSRIIISNSVLVAASAVLAFLLFIWILPPHISAQSGTAAGYGDVDPGNSHYEAITTLAGGAVFEGTECESNQFCPDDGITRRHFAVWLVRALEDAEPVVTQEDMSRFEDVDADEPEAPYIVRMAELGVTKGCSANPPLYCPDQFVSRAQMASFLVRAFEMPPAERAGFEDVGEGDTHADAIDRLASVGVTKGCSADPLLYCPSQMTTRAQMASFLMRAMRWQQSLPSTQTAVEAPSAPSDISLTLEDKGDKIRFIYDVRLSWHKTDDDIEYYVIQWRLGDEEFSESKQWIVYPADLVSDGATHNSLILPTIENACMLRVTAFNSAGSAASDEVFIPIPACELRRMIEQHIIKKYREDHPWLREVWAHMNQPGFHIRADGFGALGALSGSRNTSPLNSWTVYALKLGYIYANESLFLESQDVILHEIVHAYTLTNEIANHPGPLGMAHLYFSRMVNETDSDWCKDKAQELYADAGAALIFPSPHAFYWGGSCTPSGIYAPTEEAIEIVRQAFNGQIPDWFYANYQRDDGELDLEMIWAEVKAMELHWVRTIVVYQLRNEFGGYCDPLQAGRSASGYSDVRNPWRDGGCDS